MAKTNEFILFEQGVSEVAEGWTEQDFIDYQLWQHPHEYIVQDSGACICARCGADGNA